MSTSLRIVDAQDLLKLLAQSTQDATPDNPAEQLSDFVPAPDSGSDDVTVTDGVSTPNTPHGPTYTYGNAVSVWGLSQWG